MVLKLAGCLIIAAATWALPLSSASATVDPSDFVVEDASVLVQLCSVPEDHEYYAEAIHMCHGFVSGVAQYAFLLLGSAEVQLICYPDSPPSRTEAIGEFVTWMGTRTDLANAEASEAVVRFMEERFPCN